MTCPRETLLIELQRIYIITGSNFKYYHNSHSYLLARIHLRKHVLNFRNVGRSMSVAGWVFYDKEYRAVSRIMVFVEDSRVVDSITMERYQSLLTDQFIPKSVSC